VSTPLVTIGIPFHNDQDTLFPAASMGSFLGLFLCILGIVSSLRHDYEIAGEYDLYYEDATAYE
jgi:hypothetical protein